MNDAVVRKLIKREAKRQNKTLDLIASENFTSPDVMEAVGSVFTNKYSEGYPGKRYYPGNEYCDELENLAIARGLRLFDLSPKDWHLNVQPHSGSPANFAIYSALMESGDTLMGMSLSSGGHLTHGHKVSMTGKIWNAVQYSVDEKSGLINYSEVEKMAKKHKPKVIVCGFTAYPRLIDFKRFKHIAKKVGAYLVVDMSHLAGLIAGGAYPSPFPYADVVMTTTHKTLRGPRGAVIFARKNVMLSARGPADAKALAGKENISIAEAIDKAVFPGLQGGPHNNVTAGIAVAFQEATTTSFRKYAKRVVKNCGRLADHLSDLGFRLITNGTDSHLLLVDVTPFDIDGMTAEKRLEDVGIIANRNTIPGDKSPFKPSGLRIGTPSVTSRGMKSREMKKVAQLIHDAIVEKPGVKSEVSKLCKEFPAYNFLK